VKSTPILEHFAWAKQQGLQPALLESAGVQTDFGKLSLLGVGATKKLEVWQGVTYLNGKAIGDALAIFKYLKQGLSNDYFPAWIGFFAYEYAQYLGLPTHTALHSLPEAAFYYYPQGFAYLKGICIQKPEIKLKKQPLDISIPKVKLYSDYPKQNFLKGVREVQERIRAGWVYQVNLSHRFHFEPAGLEPLSLYQALRHYNPSPFMGLFEAQDYAVISGSPERLFSQFPPIPFTKGSSGNWLSARPIAGTRRRGVTPQEDAWLEQDLRSNIKECAEHVMLVDLLRNDLARVCIPSTVEVTEAFTVERYSHVMHLVSEVQGKSNKALKDVFSSIFPGGTITGAPKESVMQTIKDLEPVARGAYTGSLGYVSGKGADFNILIRSFSFTKDKAYFSAGSGIVIESNPEREYIETQNKAEALLLALGQGQHGQKPKAPVKDTSWKPPKPKAKVKARVLFLENHDSFSYNIIDYLSALGAKVTVVEHHHKPDLGDASHIVIGPGPGEPATSGRVLDWTKAALTSKRPVLGICLGHQAIGVAMGATLKRAKPIHGEVHPVTHRGQGLFTGLSNPALFTRYNSLMLTHLPKTVRLEAWTDDLCIGISAKDGRVWGVQFHPESMLSQGGMVLLENFLKMKMVTL
jgi:anthranilate synthase/aminodeoxychorismate synthase-like glutamine amidotransferase